MKIESRKRAEELLEQCRTITLVSVGADGYPSAGVMTRLYTQSIDAFYFLAGRQSRKVQAFLQNPKSCVSYEAPGGSVSLSGQVEVLEHSSELVQRCWRPELERIFPGGPNPEQLAVLKFVPKAATFCFSGRVEHWEMDEGAQA